MCKETFQNELHERLVKYQDKIASEIGNKVISYGEIDRRSNCIANFIVDKGVKKETQIGIIIEDRIDFILTIIGILKAGCIFVPLSSVLPKNRLDKMIDTVDISFIIGDSVGINYISELGGTRREKHQIALVGDLLAGQSAEKFTKCPCIHYTPEDRIYIYFTSGSTGVPKAIVGKNKSLLHFINWEIETFNIESNFRISQFITPLFDAFLRDVFSALFAGGVICIPSSTELILNPGELIKWIDRNGICLIHCVPGLFRMFNHHIVEDIFKSLKYILLSGESINPSDLVNWYNKLGDRIQLVNLYGPTETTMIKSFYFITGNDVNRQRIPVGKPMKGARIIICDKNLKMCDELITGEIYIRTPFRTHGYYNNPALNKEKFIPNPFTKNPDDVLYKTGDLGRFLADGNIEFLGRIDRQVKIRGIRVELEEIENAIALHPSVKEAAVVNTNSSIGIKLLVCYITEKKNNANVLEEKDLTTDLKSFLYENFPEYMVPDKVIKIDKFPRKPNGKIDYESLLGLYKDEAKNYKPPKNKLEERLAEIWKEILEVENIFKVGRDENFFESGGNSLHVMSLLSKIHREFNVRITLAQIFNNPTIETQAGIIQKSATEEFYEIGFVEEKDYYTLSSAQKRLFILQQMDLEGKGYNMPLVVVFKGNLDRDRLGEAFKKLIQRHESLRTSFELNGFEPVQRINKEVPLNVEYYELEEASDTKLKKKEEDILKSFSRAFDLDLPPLLRVGLIKVGQTKYILMVDMHHIITDGISMGLLIRDFSAIYSGEELPKLRRQYKDFSEWQNSKEQMNAKRIQEEYWLRELSGELPVINLLPDYERPSLKNFEGNSINFVIDRVMFAGLKTLAAQEGTTLFIIILSLFNIMLMKISGLEDIIVGSPVAGRRDSDFEHIIGMLVNTLALRNYPRNDITFVQFMAEVTRRTLEVFENQDYQFETLVKRLGLYNNPTRNPIFDVLFVLQNRVKKDVEIPGLKLLPYYYESGTSKFDLTLNCQEASDTLYCRFEYCTKLFKQQKIERFIQYFKDIVEAVLKNRDIMLRDIKVSHNLISLNRENLNMDFGF